MDGVVLLGSPIWELQHAVSHSDDVLVEEIGGDLYGEAPIDGVSVVAGPDSIIRSVQLHAEGHENYREYHGEIPAGLDFSVGRAEIRNRLGSPSGSGGPEDIPQLGATPAWDRFEIGALSIHVTYTWDEASVQLFAITDKALVPRR